MYFPVAEIVFQGLFALGSGADSDFNQFVDALVLACGNGDHRHAQLVGKLCNVNGVAAGPDFVHHVQGNNHGDAQLDKLEGKVKVPLNIGGVHNVDDAVGVLLQDKIPGDDFLRGVGGQGVNTRQVHYRRFRVLFHLAFLLFNGDAGKIAHMLIGAGQAVKEGGFPAVLVACKGEKQFHLRRTSSTLASSSWMLAASFLRMVST